MMDDGRPKLRGRDWAIIVVLSLSLAMNFMVIGFLGARAFSDAPPSAELGQTAQANTAVEHETNQALDQIWRDGLSPRRFIASVPPEYRSDARRQLRMRGRDALGLLRELALARRDLVEALNQEPFSAEQTRNALRRLVEVEMRIRAGGYDLVISVLERMPEDARRQTLNAILSERPPRRGGRRQFPLSRPDDKQGPDEP